MYLHSLALYQYLDNTTKFNNRHKRNKNENCPKNKSVL